MGKKLFKHELGQKVKDVYTTYTGMIMARTEHITGCVQYGLMGFGLDKDKEPRGWIWMDEDRIVPVGRVKKAKKTKGLGGPHPTAPQK